MARSAQALQGALTGRGAEGTPLSALNRRLPLWYQVAQSLRATILARRPEDPLRLPTEAALAASFGVSLVTIRQALGTLEEDGLISRQRRRGTFIRPETGPRRELRLLGSLETVFTQQASEKTTVLEKRLVPVPADLASHFPGRDKVVLFRRLRQDEGVPVSYAQNYVLPEHGLAITEAQLRRAPMTKILRDEAGVEIRRIENTVEARLAEPEAAALLGVALLSPVLLLTGVVVDRDGGTVDVARIHYRGDLYRFAVAFDTG
jgi:GntR family transcriptional regulator